MNNKKILITGGTGSLGKGLTKEIFNRFLAVKEIIIFSRDEQKHFQMRNDFPLKSYPNLKFIV